MFLKKINRFWEIINNKVIYNIFLPTFVQETRRGNNMYKKLGERGEGFNILFAEVEELGR